jgi:hypothetical protein
MTGATLERSHNKYASWGAYIGDLLDPKKYTLYNHTYFGWAIRDFFNRGGCYPDDSFLEKVTLKKINKDDDNIALVCFGYLERAVLAHHKEAYSGPRGSLPGIGNETEIVYDLRDKIEYTVYTFGEYLRKIIEICNRKGIDLCFLTPPVRDTWENGKHKRTNSELYSNWMKEVAKEYNVKYIDNNEIFSNYLNTIGEEKSEELYAGSMRTKIDKQHTSIKGAQIFAKLVYNELIKII